VLDTLVAVCRNESASVRGAVLAPVGRELVERLDGPGSDHALELFLELGRDGVPALVQGLDSDRPGLRLGCARVLEALGPTAVDALPALRRAASGPDARLADLARRAIARIEGA
jgi:HEAT repeat protein